MFCLVFWSFAAVMVCLGSNRVNAINEEEWNALKKSVHPFVMECVEENGITKEEIEEIKAKGNQATVDPCFFSCFLKKIGVFTSEGKYDIEKSTGLIKSFIKSESDLEVIDKIEQECSKVNDEEVSDGDKGCERAELLLKCFRDHKGELLIDL